MNPPLLELLPSWKLAMTSENKSPATIRTYTDGVLAFLKWCEDTGTPAILEKDIVQRWIAEMLEGGAQPYTAKGRQHNVKMFAAWLHREGEITENPLSDLKPPKLTVKVVEALTDDQIRALIAACRGSRFTDHRDEAMIRFMAETGARANEVLGIQLPFDLNLAANTVVVRKGKGGKGRVVPFSPSCASAIDRYLRHRRRLGIPEGGPLWVGANNKSFGYHGMRSALRHRAGKAKIGGVRPHVFRNTAATRWLRQGGSEAGLMAIAGWSNREMIDRYTGASASERANEEARNLNLGF